MDKNEYAQQNNYRQNTNQNLLLMKTNMDTGHSGMTGRFESLKEDAIDYAFFLMLENIKE